MKAVSASGVSRTAACPPVL